MARSDVMKSSGFSLFVFLLTMAVLLAGCSTTNKFSDWMHVSIGADADAMPIAWETSYNRAMDDAAENGKTVMLWFTGSDWCKYCTLLEEEVFHTIAFNEWYPENVIPVMLDFPKQKQLTPELEKQNQALLDRYDGEVESYPTALFVDSDGQVVGKLGYKRGGPGKWIRLAENVLDNVTKY